VRCLATSADVCTAPRPLQICERVSVVRARDVLTMHDVALAVKLDKQVLGRLLRYGKHAASPRACAHCKRPSALAGTRAESSSRTASNPCDSSFVRCASRTDARRHRRRRRAH
jgi:hypothetical protein